MWCKVKEQNEILKKYTTSTRKVTDRKRMRKESEIKQKSKSSKHKEQKNSIDRVTIQQLKCLRSLWLESCHTSCHVTTLGNIGHVYTHGCLGQLSLLSLYGLHVITSYGCELESGYSSFQSQINIWVAEKPTSFANMRYTWSSRYHEETL